MLDTFATGMMHLKFLNGHSAEAVALSSQQTGAQALAAMRLTVPQPALVIIGGASLMDADSLKRLQTVFNQVFAPLAEALSLTVLDGGTDAGVIHMMGQARHFVGGSFPLVGVVPQGKAKLPDDAAIASSVTDDSVTDDSRHDLEPHHTNFFLVPGDSWGSESPWLAEFASLVAQGQPALTILINGGQVALTDLQANLAKERPAVVLAGSGRLADTIATAMAAADTDEADPDIDPAIAELIRIHQPSGKLSVLDLALPVDQMRDRIQQYFTSVM
ncbi:hypothetical protein [Nodosilinea sp. P-1105]|uniref:hypothetical protein n=1 Tax=Nodosilinea sp. P-1105 TaxID=2546229 RepID=UPI00146B44B4|nr:hypothetical protein [Nodosilinea sp. P-1105]NMF85554.1 hypothetical protein [Nodosilinea sp. P-1105]